MVYRTEFHSLKEEDSRIHICLLTKGLLGETYVG